MREPWIGSVARRIVASICGAFACEAFTGRSSVTLHRCDKETRVRETRLGWNGLEILLGAVAPIDSEHAH
jgi:1-deoxy-D-xylulose 5-phosphate reductoisomerase